MVTRADRAGRRGRRRGVGEADALVTSDPGTVLGVLVADCVPIVLYDPPRHVVACVTRAGAAPWPG